MAFVFMNINDAAVPFSQAVSLTLAFPTGGLMAMALAQGYQSQSRKERP